MALKSQTREKAFPQVREQQQAELERIDDTKKRYDCAQSCVSYHSILLQCQKIAETMAPVTSCKAAGQGCEAPIARCNAEGGRGQSCETSVTSCTAKGGRGQGCQSPTVRQGGRGHGCQAQNNKQRKGGKKMLKGRTQYRFIIASNLHARADIL